MTTPNPSSWRQQKGQHYEDRALSWLQQQNLRLLRRNYRCPLGEIDLVMLDGATLVFIEVRFRADGHHGAAFETVDRRKQRKLLRSAQYFLLHHPSHALRACRFDVLGICGNGATSDYHWLPGAFELGA